jgi:hypothetical protein
LKIKIKTTIFIPELPAEIEIENGKTLGEVLFELFAGSYFEGQVIDQKSGKFIIGDMWQVRVNGTLSYGLPNDLDTPLHDGDIITLSMIMLGGG